MKMTVKLLDVDDKCWIQWWRWFYDETEASVMIIPGLTPPGGENAQHSTQFDSTVKIQHSTDMRTSLNSHNLY